MPLGMEGTFPMQYTDLQIQQQLRRETLRKNSIRCTFYLRLFKLAAILLQPAMFHCCWVRFYASKMADIYLWRGNLAVAVLYAVILLLLARIYRGFEVGNFERLELFISHALSQFITNCVFYILSFFLCERLVSPLPLLILQCAEMLFMFVWAALTDTFYWKHTEQEQLSVLYRDESDLARIGHLSSFLRRFTVIQKISVKQYDASLLTSLAQSDGVLIVGVDADIRNGILKDCIELGIPTYVLPKTGDILLRGAEMYLISGEIVLHASKVSPYPEYLVAKRLFDILFSLFALIVFSPIMLLTAISIKLCDGGPVLYRQARLTKDRKVFHILKFRSMRVDAEKDGKARLASEHDERITPVGRVIRSCRIDELPQLWNILRGDMTLIGPRPERPEIAAQYEQILPSFALRLQVKAGLTGYAQIYGRYNSEPYEKLQMDLMYINNMSVSEDLRLLFGTLRILLSKESTSGVEKGQKTAAPIKK